MRPVRAALPLTLLLLTAACGGGGSGLGPPAAPGPSHGTASDQAGDRLDRTDASSVLAAGVTATLHERVVHVHGTAREGSLYSSSTRADIAFDLVVDRAGGCDGTVTEEGPGAAHVRVVGTHAWLRGSRHFWRTALAGRVPSSAIDVLVGKWVESDTEDLRALCDLPEILRDGHAASDVESSVVIGDGTSAPDVVRVLVSYSDGANVVYSVQASAPHDIVHLTSAASDATEVQLTYGGPAVHVRPPPEDQVLSAGTGTGTIDG